MSTEISRLKFKPTFTIQIFAEERAPHNFYFQDLLDTFEIESEGPIFQELQLTNSPSNPNSNINPLEGEVFRNILDYARENQTHRPVIIFLDVNDDIFSDN